MTDPKFMQMYALEVKQLDADTIVLTTYDCGEPYSVCVHPEQLRIIADRFLPNCSQPSALPPGFYRDFNRIRNVASSLYAFLASVPSFPPQPEPDVDEAMALDLVKRLEDLAADYLGGEKPAAVPPAPTITEPKPRDINPPAAVCDVNSVTRINNVTQKPTKRGRPKTGNALSGAERTATYRARKAESQETLFQTPGG